MSDKLDELRADLRDLLHSVKQAYKAELEAGIDELLVSLDEIKQELESKKGGD